MLTVGSKMVPANKFSPGWLLFLCMIAFGIGGSLWFTTIGFLDEALTVSFHLDTVGMRNWRGAAPVSHSFGFRRRFIQRNLPFPPAD